MAQSKGTNLIDMVKFLRKRRDRALAGLPPHLHPYLEKRVSVSDWYPEEDMYVLLRTLASLLPEQGQRVYQTLGQLTAQNHASGSYGHLLSELRLPILAIRASALWKSLHDTGELSFEPDGDRGGVFTLSGYENPGREMCEVIGSYLMEAVRRAGVVDPLTSHESCVHGGASECRWRIVGSPSTPAT